MTLLFMLLSALLGPARLDAAPAGQDGATPSAADSYLPGWAHFGADDSLMSSTIYSLQAAGDGYIWAGTAAGLSLLTPFGEWLSFTPADGLAGEQVYAIAADPLDPALHWFATAEGAAALNDGGHPDDPAFHQWINFDKTDGLVAPYLAAVAPDGFDNVWFGATYAPGTYDAVGYGLSKLSHGGTPFDKSDDTWQSYTTEDSDLSSDAVYAILPDGAAGQVWVGTGEGLDYFDGTWTHYGTAQEIYGPVRAIVRHAGVLWLATGGGVVGLDPAGTPHDPSDDTRIVFDAFNSNLRINNIATVSFDAAGDLWVGTSIGYIDYAYGGGVSVADLGGTPFDRSDDRWANYITQDGLSNNAVRAQAQSEGAIWLGTDDGLTRFDYGASPFELGDDVWYIYRSNRQSIGQSVLTILDEVGGHVWLGTDQGLVLLDYRFTPLDKSDDRWYFYTSVAAIVPGAIRAMARDAYGRLWIGNGSGLLILDTKGTLHETYDDDFFYYDDLSLLRYMEVNDLFVDSENRVWIVEGNASDRAVQVVEMSDASGLSSARWATFTPPRSGYPPAALRSVVAAGSKVWLGSASGIAELDFGESPFDASSLNDGDDKWTIHSTATSALPENNVHDLLLDAQGNLWAGLATQGVSVRQAGGSWQHFTQADGLVMPGVQVLAGDAAGNIWIGTSGAGISVLDHGGTLGDKGDDTWTTYAAGVALPSGYIRALAVDRWGQQWVGSFGAGASVKSDVQFSRALLPYVEKVGP
ncbi:MAG: hypothetical protein M9936_11360 [Caldilinea sp.]|nr:hypothetical protein [Caldilinea sp.]MCB0066421.1 hypothetical protein [Caldilineaceae bacterium]MCB0038742.1 hypothetical protein [Caldilinea sp.]MCB0047936.1 hypothetical protein [Caldilinea sp.]MCB0133620.1 hypothetical protein [Caldilineaceae bacterium]